MSGARRRWTFGSWSSIIAVFTVLTVVFVAVWLINQSGEAAPRPEGNSDFPVIPDFDDGPSPSPERTEKGVGAAASPSPSPSPSSKSPTPPPPPPEAPPEKPELRAEYSWDREFWTVYSTVVIENTSNAKADGWTVVLVLSEGMTVHGADGARYRVDGHTVTFEPDGNSRVPGKGAVEFTFEGAAPNEGDPEVKSCTINGESC
ncbi:cellulose binding domain-containing protein [Phytomonospora sp. NPDC050363]|uniref:cellulose binding domain-containing protein n=1 Tax=Phytomonospora sp. NPDC050363 TaxID=3155642 RepID=UPI0034011FE8